MRFDPDFSETRIYADVPPGRYKVQCTDVSKEWPGNASEDYQYKVNDDGTEEKTWPMIRIEMRVIDDPEYAGEDLYPLRGFIQGPWASFGFGYIKALMPEYEKGEPFSDDDLVGREAIAIVEEDVNQDTGDKMRNVARLEPVEEE